MTDEQRLTEFDIKKGREQEDFLNRAVLKVYNECPDLRSYQDPYAIAYWSLEHDAYAGGKRKLSEAGLDTEDQIIAGLRSLSPAEKQAVLHRKIRSVIWDSRYAVDNLRDYNPVIFLASHDRWLLKHGLTDSQRRTLAEQCLAFVKFLRYLRSPQYAIDKIKQLKEFAMQSMDEMGETYR